MKQIKPNEFNNRCPQCRGKLLLIDEAINKTSFIYVCNSCKLRIDIDGWTNEQQKEFKKYGAVSVETI